MNDSADLTDLGEYFPGVVPRLVASLWKPALERAFHIQVYNNDGHLFAAGQFTLRPCMPPELESPRAAADYWREHVEPELARQVTAMRDSDSADPQAAARDLARKWMEFFFWYFLNPAAGWIERARSMTEERPELAGRGTRVRRRQGLLAEMAALRSTQLPETLDASRLLANYLDEFGAYSAHPESLVGPFPRDDRSLVEREVDLIVRRSSAYGAPKHVPVLNSGEGWADLLAIAEDDNHYKYEACYATHATVVAIGERLARTGILVAPADVWNLSIDELTTQPETRHAQVSDPLLGSTGTPGRQRATTDPFSIFGQQVVGGTADGFAWTISGDSVLPDGEVILITEGLGSIHAGSLLPYVRGLVARHGGPTSHCALIAREINCPVVVIGSDLDELRDGDHLTLREGGTIIVEPSRTAASPMLRDGQDSYGTPADGGGLNKLLETASRGQLRGLARGLSSYLRDLAEIRPIAPRGYVALSTLAELAYSHTDNDDSDVEAAQDYDHDYSDWHRLARSLWFNWGDDAPGWSAAAMAPTYWCANAVLAHSDRLGAFRMAEIGAGTGRLTHEVARHRPNGSYWVGDVSIESLALAAMLYAGQRFDVPRRTSFDQSETGLTWFPCHATSPLATASVDFVAASIPDEGAYDFIVACNSISLFPDPIRALEELAAKLAPGGRIVLCDLYCWRVETPGPRRIRGPEAIASALSQLGLSIESAQHGIPYVEDWGFERSYTWSSHAISARRGLCQPTS